MTRAQTLELAAAARRLAELLEASVGESSAQSREPSDITVEQLAERLNRTESTVRGWVAQGLFPGSYHLPASGKPDKCGRPRLGAWRIPEAALEAFRNRTNGTAALGAWRKQRGKAA
jgi:hypothetical protein